MPKFQRKSEPVEAIEWTGKNLKAVGKLFPGELRVKNDRLYFTPLTVEATGLREINKGDYLFADGTLQSAAEVEANYEEVK